MHYLVDGRTTLERFKQCIKISLILAFIALIAEMAVLGFMMICMELMDKILYGPDIISMVSATMDRIILSLGAVAILWESRRVSAIIIEAKNKISKNA